MVVRASLELRKARRMCFFAAVDPHGKLAGAAVVFLGASAIVHFWQVEKSRLMCLSRNSLPTSVLFVDGVLVVCGVALLLLSALPFIW